MASHRTLREIRIMTTWPTITQSFDPSPIVLAEARADDRPGFLARAREVLGIYDRALAAAHRFEELSRLSDEALAARGMTRTEVLRAAFKTLTDER